MRASWTSVERVVKQRKREGEKIQGDSICGGSRQERKQKRTKCRTNLCSLYIHFVLQRSGGERVPSMSDVQEYYASKRELDKRHSKSVVQLIIACPGVAAWLSQTQHYCLGRCTSRVLLCITLIVLCYAVPKRRTSSSKVVSHAVPLFIEPSIMSCCNY